MKVLTVVGARPQFIKVAPVVRAMARTADLESVLIHTGQHFDPQMSQVFFAELGIPEPDRNLDINTGSHGAMTGRMLSELEAAILDERPDWVLVYGDTNSTVAAAMATAKLPVRLAHVEAGLRSFNRTMPEEINRIVTDHVSDVCFTPTANADANLKNEGISAEKIVRTGDVMLDAVKLFAGIAERQSHARQRMNLVVQEYVLATLHRAENTDDPARLRTLADGLASLARRDTVVLPIHPRTANALKREGLGLGGVRVVAPVGYLDMLTLIGGARCVVTDSGGLQKEAFFLNRPCVTLRTETEWVELVELGWNHLVPPTQQDFEGLLLQATAAGPGRPGAPYGDGFAADRIVQAILSRGE